MASVKIILGQCTLQAFHTNFHVQVSGTLKFLKSETKIKRKKDWTRKKIKKEKEVQ